MILIKVTSNLASFEYLEVINSEYPKIKKINRTVGFAEKLMRKVLRDYNCSFLSKVK